MKKIKIVVLIVMILNMIVLSGCWDLREINELGMVTAVAIDKADGPNRYSVTVQIANPSADNSSAAQGSPKNEVWIGTADGESLFDATRNLVNISSRRIMWAHNNVIIIGEALAKEGITPIVDFFTHNPELRMKTAVIIAKGTAKEYMSAKIGMDSPTGISFISLEGYRSLSAESIESHMLQVSSVLRDKHANNIISAISLKKAVMQSAQEKEQAKGQSQTQNQGQNQEQEQKISETVELSGAAVFKKDKMIGWLSPEEAKGVAWMLGQTHNTSVTVIDPEHENKSVSVETSGVKTSIKSEIVDGMPTVSINMKGRGRIVEEDGPTDQDMSEVKKNIGELVGKRIEDDVKQGLEAIQKKYMVDCLGFASIVHVQNHKEWHDGLEDMWDETFPEIPVQISVDISIDSSTLNQEPMKASDKAEG